MVEHQGYKLLIESDEGRYRYTMFKFINDERFPISQRHEEDTEATRNTFVADALKGFERARAAPFN
jgi:hypothetical protein